MVVSEETTKGRPRMKGLFVTLFFMHVAVIKGPFLTMNTMEGQNGLFHSQVFYAVTFAQLITNMYIFPLNLGM